LRIAGWREAGVMPDLHAPRAHGHIDPAGPAFLAFRLDGEEYGIDINAVREVRAAACGPARVMPAEERAATAAEPQVLLDLRTVLGLATAAPAPAGAMIALGTCAPSVAILVDSVCDVVAFDLDELGRKCEVPSVARHDCVAGIGVRGERTLVLIDIDCALARACNARC